MNSDLSPERPVWTRAFVGIGSNIGDRVANCERAIDLIRSSPGCAVIRVSGFYETDPVGYEEQNRFVNAVLSLDTTLPPLALLDTLLGIETLMGRKRLVRWGPRVIDLDLLFYGDLRMNHPRLVIPHPRAHERGFVLIPLCEIAPDLAHPTLHRPAATLLEALPDAREGVIRL